MRSRLNYVAGVLEKEIFIRCGDKSKYSFLKNLGAKKLFMSVYSWRISYKSSMEIAGYFDKLRNENFLFSVDEGLSPASKFHHLREQGLLKDSFIEIYWTEAGEFKTRKV